MHNVGASTTIAPVACHLIHALTSATFGAIKPSSAYKALVLGGQHNCRHPAKVQGTTMALKTRFNRIDNAGSGGRVVLAVICRSTGLLVMTGIHARRAVGRGRGFLVIAFSTCTVTGLHCE